MVYVQDEGSRFDAPLEVVWEYLSAGEAHDRAHRSTRNPKFEPISHSSFTYSAERHVGDDWIPETTRFTVLQPLGIAAEMLDGLLAGSKMVYVYKPKGRQTEIDVYGDFHSKMVPPAVLERTVLQFLASEYEEDEPALRRFAASK